MSPLASLASDWIDRLASEGLPGFGDDPPAAPAPPAAQSKDDRFELIWPSGDVDGSVGSVDRAEPAADAGRDPLGPTVSPGSIEPGQPPVPRPAQRESGFGATPVRAATVPTGGTRPVTDDVTDEVVLAVRRAVASIETSSLDARRRPSADASTDPDDVATASGGPVVSPRSRLRATSRSVFDEPTATEPADRPVAEAAVAPPTVPDQGHDVAPAEADEPQRVSALRRLIGGLRKR